MNTQHLSPKIRFTKEMKETHTIFIPTMLPVHFEMIAHILTLHGYQVKLLTNSGHRVINEGLKNVHNDTCYPAQLVIGQLIDALEHTDIPRDKIALLITQTGGGCRASNYLHLLRKALKKGGYGDIPVISIGFVKGEKNEGFSLTPPILLSAIYAIFFGDLIMTLDHQCRPYELHEGDSGRVVRRCIEAAKKLFDAHKLPTWGMAKKLMVRMIEAFEKIPRSSQKKPRVGVVGEIYVKYSPLGNNNLEDFLLSEGCEIVCPGLLDFLLYCLFNSIFDYQIYGLNGAKALAVKQVCNLVCAKKREMIRLIEKHSHFEPPCDFEETVKATEGYIGVGVKMGEGWLLTAEMVELIQHFKVNNIVCTQPFGCLPNHIAGKGVMRVIKEKNPQANIVAVDYDSGASEVNQQNRIKLMLANTRLQEDSPQPERDPALV